MPERRRGAPAHLLLGPFDDLQDAMAQAFADRPLPGVLGLLAGLVVTWFVYVPIHELLHVLGCIATGGSVSELEVDPLYGGALLARFLPFVIEGDGTYAGRLTGFDTHGSDWIYLATDITPYLLSVGIGLPLLRVCARRSLPLVTGAAVVIGFAPLYNITGDYYEMGSILVTRLASWVSGTGIETWEALRSDDVFALAGTLSGNAATGMVEWAVLGAGVVSGVALALLSMAAGVAVSDAVAGRHGAAALASEE